MSGDFEGYIEVFTELMEKGYKVILAHPERYLSFQKDYKKINELESIGVLFQSNIDSINGGYGKKAKKMVNKYYRAKFNYNKFVRDFYLEGNTAFISVRIDDYYDIISKYSINNYEWLNDKFAKYVEDTAYYIPVDYDMALDINGNFTDEEKEKIVKTIKQFFGMKLGDAENNLLINKKKNIILLVTSILFLFIFSVLTIYIPNFKFSEIISILLWFILWEYLNNTFIAKRELTIKKLEMAQLASMEIKFNEDVTRKREV